MYSAVKRAQSLGLGIAGIEVKPDGSYTIMTSTLEPGSDAELLQARARRNARKADRAA